jgi:hypothetical protein
MGTIKKQVPTTVSWRVAKGLTAACAQYTERVRAKELTFTTRKVKQDDGSFDTVYMYMKPSTRFMLEFTQQVNFNTGEKYVNWSRVSGPQADQDEFLKLAKYIFFQEESSEDELPDFN